MMILLSLLAISFFILLIGVALAPSSINKDLLNKSDGNKFEILQIPHIFLRKWYEEEKTLAWKFVVTGTIGLLVGFSLTYILYKLGIIS